MKTSRKPRTTKTRTKSDAYFSLSDEEIDRRAHEYDEARDRAALVWKGIGKQAREMNAAAERAKSKFAGTKFLPKNPRSAKDAFVAKAANAMVDFEDSHVSYECRDKDCTMCKGLMEEGTGRLATMYDHDTDAPHQGIAGILTGGEVRVTDPKTGGQKGKKLAQLGAIDPASLLELAKVAGYGQAKYARFNYLKGFDWSLLIDALYRHLLAFQNGEELDPESGLSHAAHVAWHALALVSFSQRKLGTDDGYRPEGEFAPEPEPEEMS
jgi:hypothetical protein